MAKVPGKGTVIEHTISAALTPIAQVLSIEESGGESETYQSSALDLAGAHHEYTPTGYSQPGTLQMELYFDPALAGHQFIASLIKTPALNAMNLKYADAGTTAKPFTSAGVALGQTIAMDDGVRASVTHQITGDPGWPSS